MTSQAAQPDIFATTHWSLVLRAGRADTPKSMAALSELCSTYWYPLYVYVRSRGHNAHDAEDLTQGFFAKLLRLESLVDVSPEKGKFRAFLLAALKNHLADEWARASAAKRDTRITFSLDAAAAEARFADEPVDDLTPERLFERRWALTLLQSVMERLQADYEANGRGKLFRQLRFSITGDKGASSYRDLAAELDSTEEAIRAAVFRLRKSYKIALREAISHTVSTSAEVDEELTELRRILSGD